MKRKILIVMAALAVASGAQASVVKKHVTPASIYTCVEEFTDLKTGKNFRVNKFGEQMTVQVIDYGYSFTVISNSNGAVAQSGSIKDSNSEFDIGRPMKGVAMSRGVNKMDGIYTYVDSKASITWNCIADE